MRPQTPPKRAPSLEDSMEAMDTTSSASMDLTYVLNGDDKAVEEDITRLLDITDIPLSLPDQIVKLPTLANAGSGKVTMSSASDVRIKLKPDWKIGEANSAAFLNCTFFSDVSGTQKPDPNPKKNCKPYPDPKKLQTVRKPDSTGFTFTKLPIFL